MTIPQAAARLEMSPGFVRRLIARGDLACYRHGRSIRLAESDVEDYRRSCRSVAAPDHPSRHRGVVVPSWYDLDQRIRTLRSQNDG